MSRFSTKEEVKVTVDDSGDAIYIRGTMNLETRNKVLGMAGKVTSDSKEVAVDIGAYNTALMLLNIIRWEGPGFDGLSCTPENIKELSPLDPLVEKTLSEINARNKSEDTDDASPNSPSGGSESSKESTKGQWETTTDTLTSQNGSDGPPIKLMDYQHTS